MSAASSSEDCPVDVIYVAASRLDGRFTRICVASIRHFYPDVPVRLVVGGPLEPGLEEELRRYWNVGVADLPPGNYGWGFVKLEPLFAPPGERFLMLDSDTIITGPVLDLWKGVDEPFLVDRETQTEDGAALVYYRWTEVADLDEEAAPPAFLFNTGQWFGTSGIVRREDFSRWVEWSIPRRLVAPSVFKNGDQGVMNYVFNVKAARGEIDVARGPLMRWPGHNLDDLVLESIVSREAPAHVIHWAGMKDAKLGAMVRHDLLNHFEKLYYSRVPGGQALRLARAMRYASEPLRRRLSGRLDKIFGRQGQ